MLYQHLPIPDDYNMYKGADWVLLLALLQLLLLQATRAVLCVCV
jgi:hypothetical protein